MRSFLLCLVLTVASAGAMADSMRKIKALPIICIGTLASKPLAVSIVHTETGGTRISLIGSLNRTFEVAEQLTVGSEGSTYIQQVSSKEGYNLMLSSGELDELLAGNETRSYEMTGELTLTKLGQRAMLKCRGQFVK